MRTTRGGTGETLRTFRLFLAVDASRELGGCKVLDGVEEGDDGDEELPVGEPACALGEDWAAW